MVGTRDMLVCIRETPQIGGRESMPLREAIEDGRHLIRHRTIEINGHIGDSMGRFELSDQMKNILRASDCESRDQNLAASMKCLIDQST